MGVVRITYLLRMAKITSGSSLMALGSQSDLDKAVGKVKLENYQLVVSDLVSRGYSANFTTIEIGVLGHWLPHTRSDIIKLFPSIPKSALTHLVRTATSIITASHVIFSARLDRSWNLSRALL